MASLTGSPFPAAMGGMPMMCYKVQKVASIPPPPEPDEQLSGTPAISSLLSAAHGASPQDLGGAYTGQPGTAMTGLGAPEANRDPPPAVYGVWTGMCPVVPVLSGTSGTLWSRTMRRGAPTEKEELHAALAAFL
mmetsp:Transcript_18549/g.33570  ORF Transcript_18549/g.33570 Transcript_18549/m.33570 type:complete len:134 (+) Transcript_18549:68-469(+)